MFTGIIEAKGMVLHITATPAGGKIVIEAPAVARRIRVGGSLCVNGVCLTVTQKSGTRLFFDLSPETLARTNLGDIQKGAAINIETSLTLGRPLDGHLVQGHVDATGRISKNIHRAENAVMEISMPGSLSSLVAEKGSIAVDGVSLTVTKVRGNRFQVALIPHTLSRTNLSDRSVGDRVNLEVDPIARYLERQLHHAN